MSDLRLLSLEKAFAAHQAERPEIPRGLPADHPQFIEWHLAFSKWCATKERLLAKLNAHCGMNGRAWIDGGAA